jgi:mono/diheme cytochrome c family protein
MASRFVPSRRLLSLIGVVALVGSTAGAGRAETSLERGRYLVTTILACGNCHTPRDAAGGPIPGRELAGGGLSFKTPAFNATAANITPDRETGIGNWSDDEIKAALTQGNRPGDARLAGVPLAAVMPAGFYKAILPQDLDAVVAYLRSLSPVRNKIETPVYKLPVRRDPYPAAEAGFRDEDLRNPVRRGAYLVTIGHCMECHAAWDKGISDYKNGLGRGGRVFNSSLVQGFPADWPGAKAANISSHPMAGIGAWTDAEITSAIAKGVSHDGHKLKPPMAFAWYAGMSEPDLDAIVAYLRTLPPLE